MSPIFDFLFQQYDGYAIADIVLEVLGVLFGLTSVWYAKKNNIWVYPTGMISTAIFVYLLLKWSLLGDMLINGYFFVMSAYGWFYWTRKKEEVYINPISTTVRKEYFTSAALFIGSLLFVYWIYVLFDKWNDWTAYVDTFTTAIFFVGMWLMARRKIENWIFWIIGDFISIPLYFYKGLTLTSIQYIIFTAIAIYGYRSWKKILNKSLPAA
jgi:nicotinamide mononucleotide transporter